MDDFSKFIKDIRLSYDKESPMQKWLIYLYTDVYKSNPYK